MAINTESQVLVLTAAKAGKESMFKLWLARMLALSCVLICLVFGLAGIILPVIPGLLFLALAAMIAARHIPSLDRWLRKHASMRRYLDSGQGFLSLTWQAKIRFVLWLGLKILIDTLALIFRALFSLMSFRPGSDQGESA